MKITDLIIDPKSLGSKLWLVEVSPAYEYQNNRRTDTVLGYRYTVALPEKCLEKVNVRIDGAQICYDNCIIHIGRFSGKECALWRESAKIEMAEY